jgi:hypothetical protein
MLLLLGRWWWRLPQKLIQPWMFRGLSAFAQDALPEPINLILLLTSRKGKKRRLRRVSSLDRDVGTLVPAAEEVPVPEFTDAELNGGAPPAADPNGSAPSTADPNGGAPSAADPNGCVVCVADENDGEEEDEVPLTRKNSRQYVASGESSGVPSPALSALIGLQDLSLANFDQTLEDMVPEDLLSEPADDGVMEVCTDVLDAGLGSSRASSTLERGLEGQETDLDRLAPMEVTEGPSALEAATAENLVLEDGVDTCPAPEDVAGMTRLGWGTQATAQPPRVLPEMIRLKWVAQTIAQPPRVSERGLPLVLPWMFMQDLLRAPVAWW